MCKLFFSSDNAKLGKNVLSFSLPSGYTCPGAEQCLSKANRKTGKIKDGKKTEFRCFSASQEALFSPLRNKRWENFETLKMVSREGAMGNPSDNMFHAILENLSFFKQKIVRIHIGGDFFSEDYFLAWWKVAREMTEKTFYFYTKSLNYWVKNIDFIGNGKNEPKNGLKNFIPTASRGGKYDDLIEKFDLREAKVFFYEADAQKESLEIDHDDSHAQKFGESFALLLHGIQPKNSAAQKAKTYNQKHGFSGYSRISLNTI